MTLPVRGLLRAWWLPWPRPESSGFSGGLFFFLFYAVVATLRLDYFSKRMIDWYASYLR
jgi:hypothetical protein